MTLVSLANIKYKELEGVVKTIQKAKEKSHNKLCLSLYTSRQFIGYSIVSSSILMCIG